MFGLLTDCLFTQRTDRQTAELYLGIKSDFLLFFMLAHSHRLQIPKGSFTLKSLLVKMREVLCVPLNRVTVLSNRPPTESSRRTDADCNVSLKNVYLKDRAETSRPGLI